MCSVTSCAHCLECESRPMFITETNCVLFKVGTHCVCIRYILKKLIYCSSRNDSACGISKCCVQKCPAFRSSHNHVACVLNWMTSLSLVTCRAAPGGEGRGGIHETLRGFSFICECHQLHYCYAFSFVSYPTTGFGQALGVPGGWGF